MARKNRANKSNTEKNNIDSLKISKPESIMPSLRDLQVIIELLTAVALIVGFLITNNNVSRDVEQLKNENGAYKSEVNTSLNEFNATLSEYSHNQQEYERRLGDYAELKGKFNEIEAMAISNSVAVYPTEETKSIIDASYKDIKEEKTSNDNAILIEPNEIIASDYGGKHKYTVDSIAGVKVIMPYMQNEKETYFCGQFNNSLHWNGDCVINQYKDDKLIYVCEAIYLDGDLMSYQQAYYDNKERLWRISERFKDEDYFEGYTWEYTGVDDVEKKISFENARGTDIVTIDIFSNGLAKAHLSEFYAGRTAGGNYNDQTSNAYFVSFDNEGYVATLYEGRMKDGQFNDDSGEAWYITRKTQDGREIEYQYYQGVFKDRTKVGDFTEKDISIDRIYEIIKDREYAIKLEWKTNARA